MIPRGVTRWPTRTPGSTVMVHERGNCRSATRRIFRAACSMARKSSRGTALRAARNSARLTQIVSRVRRSPSRRRAQRKSAASPSRRTLGENARRHLLGSRVGRAAPGEEFRGGRIGEFENAHHNTILLSGYSTIPCAPAAFRRGMM